MGTKDSRRQNEQYYLSRGRCQRCGRNPLAPGMKVCEECREKNNRQRREYRALRKAMGLCTQCGGKRDDERFAMCGKCREKERVNRGREKKASRKKWYDARRENGECVTCGKLAEPGKARCKACQRKASEVIQRFDPNREKKRLMRQQRREAGLCIDCGTPAEDGKSRCPRCLEARHDSTRKYQIHKKIMAQNERERLRLIRGLGNRQ